MRVIVVEGTHDAVKINSIYPNVECVVTNGSQIGKETLDYIKTLSLENEIIIFTDPDSPGERIRSIILETVPSAKQAFLRKKDCISNNKKKIGIEHASIETIKEALSQLVGNETTQQTISLEDLYDLGLLGNSNSSILRSKISDELNIGNPNGKTFLKRINLLGLTKENIEEMICRIK